MDNEEVRFSWAERYPEVHKVCKLFDLTDLNDPVKYSYRQLPSCLQEGPQCGLVALTMYMGHNSKEVVFNLYEDAQRQGFTSYGEMFSVENMSHLAKSHNKAHTIETYSGPLDSDHIKCSLLSGANLLVPYDAGRDNYPALHNGQKAHWAVICGAVKTETDFYVIARHGKVRNVAIWKLSDLSASNSQLNQFENGVHLDYKMPQGGITGPSGLRRKCVVLTPP